MVAPGFHRHRAFVLKAVHLQLFLSVWAAEEARSNMPPANRWLHYARDLLISDFTKLVCRRNTLKIVMCWLFWVFKLSRDYERYVSSYEQTVVDGDSGLVCFPSGDPWCWRVFFNFFLLGSDFTSLILFFSFEPCIARVSNPRVSVLRGCPGYGIHIRIRFISIRDQIVRAQNLLKKGTKNKLPRWGVGSWYFHF